MHNLPPLWKKLLLSVNKMVAEHAGNLPVLGNLAIYLSQVIYLRQVS